MSLWCLPSSFGSIGPMVWKEMSFEEFLDGCHGSNLGYLNGTILAILNLYNAPVPPIEFLLNLVWEEMSFEEFQDGSNLGYLNGTILAFWISIMLQCLPSSFCSIWFGRRCRLKNFKMAPWRLSWILERNDFSNSESLCHCDASHRFGSIQLKVWEERCRLKNFKMATMAAIF